MKNNLYHLWQGVAKKALPVLLLQLVVLFSALAAPNGLKVTDVQKAKVTITVVNTTLQDFMKKVEAQTTFKFTYDENELPKKAQVSVSAKNESLEKVLDKVGASAGVEFKQVNNYIHVRVRNAAPVVVIPSTSRVAPVTVTGKVTDAKGEPLPGVTVMLKGTTNATATGIDGSFSLTVPDANGTLVFSYIGFIGQEVALNGRSTLSIALAEDAKALEEVVVIGYGTQERKDITSAVSVVSSEAFESRPNTQIGSLIQGKAAGVQIASTSGKPGAGLNIRIRGTNSINSGSDPLYVVDGVPTTDTRSLNPADVENIVVLKDAGSAAIYGSQAANGVVLITTKRGKEGKPRFDFSTYRGFSSVWKTLDVLNGEQYRDLMTELGYNTDWSRYTENTDWQKEVFQNGTSQNYQMSLSGKNENTSYYLSGGWVQQEGAVRSSEMDRYSFKVNLDQKVNNWLNVGTSVGFTRYHDVDVTDNSAVNQGGVILGVLSTPPVIGIYQPNGMFTSNPFQNWENPIASTDGAVRGYKNNRLLGNLYAEAEILSGLKYRSNFGLDYSNAMYDYFLDPNRTSYGVAMKGIGRNQTWLSNYWIWDNTVTYSKEVGKHTFSALAGTVAQKWRWEDNSIERRNFASDAIITPGAGAQLFAADASKREKYNASFISRVTYDFAGKYLLQVNFRADGSNNFGPSQRWGYFPSFSLGWRVSDEEFMKNISLINNLKLRGGWGIVGNDQTELYGYRGRVGSGGNYPIGGVVMPGTYQASIENNNLKWEESEQSGVGVDLAVLNNRITFTADAYVKNTRDLLLRAPLPTSTGFGEAIQNVGRLQNKGLEFQVTTRNFDKEFTWDTDFNISFNRNKVIDVVGQQLFFGNIAGRGDVSLVREGLPLGTIYGYVAGGVDPATGDVFYINKNGESTFTPAADDRRIIGNTNPDFQYGLTNTLGYKGFGLNIFLQGSQGNDIFNATRIETEGMLDPKNQTIAVVNRWRNPGDITDIPRAVANSTANSLASTRFIEDGSYLRVKAITFSYDFPAAVLTKAHLSNLRLYVTGENLFTITDYSGFDPEVNAFGSSNTAQGIDFGTYPQTRNLIFGLSVSF